jgi:hypothetical protein
MMNKKAADLLTFNTVFITVLVLFVTLMFLFLYEKKDGAALQEDYYAKKIATIIDVAQPGDEISLDVHAATKIAKSNNIPFSDIFLFDNNQSEFCIKISSGRKTCYSYYNNVDVISPDIKLGQGAEGINVLTFKISEKLKKNA